MENSTQEAGNFQSRKHMVLGALRITWSTETAPNCIENLCGLRWKPSMCLWALASYWPILTGAICCDCCDVSPQSSHQLLQMLSLHIVLTCSDNQDKPRKKWHAEAILLLAPPHTAQCFKVSVCVQLSSLCQNSPGPWLQKAEEVAAEDSWLGKVGLTILGFQNSARWEHYKL